MGLLVDLFGYLSVILHGLAIVAQSVMLGGILFLALLARPLGARLGPEGARVLTGSARIAAWGGLGLLGAEALRLALQGAVLADTAELSLTQVLTANFAVAGLAKMAAAGLAALLLLRAPARLPIKVLLGLGALELAAATLTTHAAARLDGFATVLGLEALEALHQFGAALWIGGLPCFLLALSCIQTPIGMRLAGARYSRMSMAGVASILASGIGMSLAYIGDLQGVYGTSYGVMVVAKTVLFLVLLGLGGMNFLILERLRRGAAGPTAWVRRFVEVELGIGITIFLAAASLTSAVPAGDMPASDRVSLHEIVERNAPRWPRLVSPDHDTLALPELQKRLDRETAARAQTSYVPGSGEIPPRNAADVAWSEYNHHWSGICVLAIAVLALANRAGWRWARHWPLIFLLLAGFIFVRSDPETWPLGHIGLIESLRDVEVLQHRVFALLIVAFALFEWRVRAGPRPWPRAALVFPLVCASGGALLLTHTHAVADAKEQVLIELTHTPLALAAVLAGWARWLELRLPADAPPARVAAWVWPTCLLIVALILLDYREA